MGVVVEAVQGERKGFGGVVGVVEGRRGDRRVSGVVCEGVCRIVGSREWEGMEDDMGGLEEVEEKEEEGGEVEEGWKRGCEKRIVELLVEELEGGKGVWRMICLGWLLRPDELRREFCEKNGLKELVRLLGRDGKGIKEGRNEEGYVDRDEREFVYRTLFVVWMLSFVKKLNCRRVVLNSVISTRLIKVLVALLDDVRKQRLKVARITLAILRNLVDGKNCESLQKRVKQDMVSVGMMNVLDRVFNTVGQLWCADIETAADAEFLKNTLEEAEKDMTTFDRYIAQVSSGSLQWSSMHRDPMFFKEHVEKLVSSHRRIIQRLAEVVAPDTKVADEIRIIACNDLKQIVDTLPSVRAVSENVPKLKAHLFQLMIEAKNPEVRQNALLCAQKLLVRGQTTR